MHKSVFLSTDVHKMETFCYFFWNQYVIERVGSPLSRSGCQSKEQGVLCFGDYIDVDGFANDFHVFQQVG